MVRFIFIVFSLISFVGLTQDEDYIRPGLISSGLTISPSMMLNRGESSTYLSGFLEGYLDKHISIRGETHYFVDGLEDDPYFKFASRTTFGVLYHVNKNNLDAHIGFLPGLSVLEVNENVHNNGLRPTHITPTIAFNIGGSFYVWKYVHFFANVTYINSTIRNLPNTISGRTDELMISAGLGFNLNAIKKK